MRRMARGQILGEAIKACSVLKMGGTHTCRHGNVDHNSELGEGGQDLSYFFFIYMYASLYTSLGLICFQCKLPELT